MIKPCFLKYWDELKLNPAQGKERRFRVSLCMCVCMLGGGAGVELLNSIAANYHNYVHFSSLPARVKEYTFENLQPLKTLL